jgi:hypothetical protein
LKTLDSGIFAEKATRYLSSTYVFNEKIKKLDVDDGDHDDDAANAAVDADSLENSNNCWLPWLQISPAMGPRRMESFFGTGRVTRGIDVEDRYCFLPGQA